MKEGLDMVPEPYGYQNLHECGEVIRAESRPEIEPGGPIKKVWPVDP